MILIIIFLIIHAVVAKNCLYYNKTRAVCENIRNYKNLSRNVRSVLLKNCCDFQINDWKNFTSEFPELDFIKFDPSCKDCLKIDENFNGMRIDGRCLESDMKCRHREQLSTISNEIASLLVLVIMLTFLYLIRFIKYEILQHFGAFRRISTG